MFLLSVSSFFGYAIANFAFHMEWLQCVVCMSCVFFSSLLFISVSSASSFSFKLLFFLFLPERNTQKRNYHRLNHCQPRICEAKFFNDNVEGNKILL